MLSKFRPKRLSVAGLAWVVAGLIVFALIGAGFNVMGYSPPDYAFARACFVGAAAILSLVTVLWSTIADEPILIRAIIGALVGLLVFVLLPESLRYITIRQEAAATHVESAKDLKIAMARRWIRLADDISADLPSMKYFAAPAYSPEMSPELREQLWKHKTEESMNASKMAIESARIKYRGRLASARDEMLKVGISLNKDNLTDIYLEDPTLSLVNGFSFQQWANKLNIEAREILTSYGISE